MQIHADTCRYIQIHTETYRSNTGTCRYIQIHTGTYRYIQASYRYFQMLPDSFWYLYIRRYLHAYPIILYNICIACIHIDAKWNSALCTPMQLLVLFHIVYCSCRISWHHATFCGLRHIRGLPWHGRKIPRIQVPPVVDPSEQRKSSTVPEEWNRKIHI